MKILYLLPYTPAPATFGGAMRVFHLMRLASEHNDVSVLSYGQPEQEEMLRSSLKGRVTNIKIITNFWPQYLRRAAQLYSLVSNHSFFYMLARSKEMQANITRILEKYDFDIVQTEFAHMGSFELATNAHKVLDAHNVEYDNFRRMAEKTRSLLRRLHYNSESKKFFHEEQTACRQHDSVFVTSRRDKIILDTLVPEIPKYVIPNGVDSSFFTPSNETPEPYSMVFTGSMSYVPNNDGMVHFLDDIFPRILKKIPQAKIYIVGSRPMADLRRRSSHNIIITDYVDDVRPFIWRSSVYVVPLRMGSGTRLKVLEAMAMKKPIVTTSIGCEGIDVVNGESAIITDEPEVFADAVIRLLTDRITCRQLAERSHDLMRSHYEWSVIGWQVESLFQQLAGKQLNNRLMTRATA